MRSLVIIVTLFFSINLLFAQNLKPYILGFETTESVTATKDKVKANLESNGIKVAGQYQPANDNNRWIFIITSTELQNAVKSVGGLTGFAAALRVGITREGDKTKVSYTNPAYWGNAYFRDDFKKVASNYTTLDNNITAAMKASGTFLGTSFGSKKGISAEDLQDYHYMLGMPYFDDTVELGKFDSHQAALDKVEASIKKGVTNVKMVYKINIPGNNLVLYGFSLSGNKGESKFLPTIDISNPKHTAFLPYELLVMDNKVHILHGRFRIALSFPDLTMGTFTKIMSTPGDIEDILEQLVK